RFSSSRIDAAQSTVASQASGSTADHGRPPTLSMNTSVLVHRPSSRDLVCPDGGFSVIVAPPSLTSNISVHELRLAFAFVADHEDQQLQYVSALDAQLVPVGDVVEAESRATADPECGACQVHALGDCPDLGVDQPVTAWPRHRGHRGGTRHDGEHSGTLLQV